MVASATPRIRDLPDAPHAPGAADDGSALVWRQTGGAYVLETPGLGRIIPKSGFFAHPTTGSGTTFQVTNRRLYATPVWLPAATYDALGFYVATIATAGSTVRCGIYSDDGTGQPGNLLLDAGTGASDVLGQRTILLGAALVVAKLMLVWMATLPQGTPATPPVLHGYSGNFATSRPDCYTVRGGYFRDIGADAFPAAFGAQAGPILSVAYCGARFQ